MAAVPMVLLVGLLAVRVGDAARYRSADSYFTELSVEGADRPTVVVRSHERETVTFRYEERRAGVVVLAARFTLQPGEHTDVAVVSSPPSGVDIYLYKVDQAAPYRRVTV